MEMLCVVCVVLSLLSTHPNHYVVNHTQACFPKSICWYMDINATTGFKMMVSQLGPNLEIQFLQMSTKSCANVDVKLKYKGEVDKQLDDQYEH